MSRVGKYPDCRSRRASTSHSQGRTVVAKGKLGELTLDLTDDVDVDDQGQRGRGEAARTRPPDRGPCGAPRAA
jgi:large subunit ribosomal protein L6